MGTSGITSQFASWAEGLNADDIPVDGHRMAQRAMFDTLGVMIAGGAHDDVAQLARIRPPMDGPCGLATGGTVPAAGAALINGMAAHFRDIDDTTILPAACNLLNQIVSARAPGPRHKGDLPIRKHEHAQPYYPTRAI